jgi:hypothetical protein
MSMMSDYRVRQNRLLQSGAALWLVAGILVLAILLCALPHASFYVDPNQIVVGP